jgi:hypothetical protein
MNLHTESDSPVAFCVPLQRVESIDEIFFDLDLPDEFIYPAASASYSYSYPLEDEDFCDIITQLAHDENEEYLHGPSAVAMPISGNETELCHPALSFAVPEVCYDVNGFECVPVKAVTEYDVDYKSGLDCNKNCEFLPEDIMMQQKTQFEKKMRRLNAVHRLKEKRQRKKYRLALKALQLKDAGKMKVKVKPQKANLFGGYSEALEKREACVEDASSPVTVAEQNQMFEAYKWPKKDERIAPPSASARQIAACYRERENGKFKHNKTQWVSVTELQKKASVATAQFAHRFGLTGASALTQQRSSQLGTAVANDTIQKQQLAARGFSPYS